MASRMERLQSTVRSGRRTSTNSCSREVGSGFILPIAPAPHCYSLSYLRVYRYTYPCLHYSSTRLLQLTLCWPPSWAVTMPRQGPAHCHTPLWAHPQIWPRFQVYAGCAPLAPPPTEDFVPYNFLNLAVPTGSCSRLSSRPLPHYHGNSGSSLSPLNRAGSSSRPICPHCNYTELRLLSCWSLALEWAIFGVPIVP